MTIPPVTPKVRSDVHPLDMERLQVAARAVLEWLGTTSTEGPTGARLEQVTHHARALADVGSPVSTPFAATRAHALTLRNELITLATEQSLTMAVWLDDALGLGAHRGAAIPIDPAEIPAGALNQGDKARRQG